MKRAALALLLASCASVPMPISRPAGPQPADADQVIARYLDRSLKDPESLRQFVILPGPRVTDWYFPGPSHDEGWLYCFEYNAKNSYGGYVGVQRAGILLRVVDGATAIVVEPTPLLNSRC